MKMLSGKVARQATRRTLDAIRCSVWAECCHEAKAASRELTRCRRKGLQEREARLRAAFAWAAL